MNNKPVAWMYEKPSGASKLSFVQEKMLWDDMKETPLYTHPVTVPMLVLDGNRVYPAIKDLTDEEWITTYQTWALTSNDPLVLKRAILKKAKA